MSSIRESAPSRHRPSGKHFRERSGKAWPRVLALLVLSLAIVAGVSWCYHIFRGRTGASDPADNEIRLSEGTRRALKRLHSPVEIRFYSLLGRPDGSDPLQAFSGRVERLLSAYERQAGGNLVVRRFHSGSDENVDAASSDGLKAFHLDKGEPWFLGLSVTSEDRKELLPRITPEWEEALEADLTRAILRVNGERPQAAATTDADRDAGEEVKLLIPDFASVSLEEGRELLRERTIGELKTVTAEMQSQIEKARERLRQAQETRSEEDQKAAMQEVRQLQSAQADELKKISARLDAQIAALERLKKGASDPP